MATNDRTKNTPTIRRDRAVRQNVEATRILQGRDPRTGQTVR